MNLDKTAQEFEKYRLIVQIDNDHTLQLVREPYSDTTTWQRWKRRRDLGQGAFGQVWQEAREDEYGDWHYRAVKTCSERSMQAARIDYKRELSALAAFSNSECSGLFVNLHGWWMESGSIFVAMEYLRYGDLSRYAPIGIPETDVREIAKDVLKGLEVMHQEGFTHRDIKPQNILVFQKKPEHPRWWVKIADFGISKQTPESSDTALHTVIGTRPYCAPEVLGYLTKYAETSFYSSKVDIWSLGCVLFNVVSHDNLPFSESDLVRYCDQIVPFNPRNLPLHLGDDGASFIKHLLQSEPESRPTATEALRHSWLTTVSRFVPSHDATRSSIPPSNSRNFNSFLDSPVPTASLTQHASAAFGGPFTTAPSLTLAQTVNNPATVDGKIRSADQEIPVGRIFSPPSAAQHPSLELPERPLRKPLRVSPDLHDAVSARKDQENVTSAAPKPFVVANEIKPHVGGRVPSATSQDADEDFSLWQSKNADQLNGVTFMGHPYHLAAYLGDLHVLKYLAMRGADANEKLADGMTPLHFAADSGNLNIAKWLVLEQKADIHARGKSDWIPLMWTAYHGRLEMAKWFVEQGADVNVKVADGLTPLHWAANRGQLEVTRYFAAMQADIDAKTNAGQTPLHYAAEQGHLEVVKWLVECHADMSAKTNVGLTPLHWAAQNGHLEVVKWLVKQHSDGVHAKTNFGETPLHCAAIDGHLQVIKWLVEQHADIDPRIDSGCIPLHYAANYGHLEVVKYFVEKGADVNDRADAGWTPLHYAASEGHFELVKWLVQEGGAAPLQKSVSGQTPGAIVETSKYPDVAAWLKEQEKLKEAGNQLKDRTLRSTIRAEKADSGKKATGWRRMFS